KLFLWIAQRRESRRSVSARRGRPRIRMVRRSIMKRVFCFSIVLLLVAAASALAQDVRYNFDKNTDFSKFKTYKWVPIKGADKVSDLVDKQIKDAVDAELATK